MALVSLQTFDGTAATVVSNGGSDYLPNNGPRFARDISGAGTTLDGSGNAVLASGGLAHHYSPSTYGDCTIKGSLRNNTGSTQNGANFFMRGGTSLFSNQYALNVDWFGNGLRLISTADGTVASFNPGLSAATFVPVWIVIEGFRIRVWVNGNTGTPNIDWTDPNTRYASGNVGWWADSAGSDIAEFEFWDSVELPGATPPTDPPGVSSFRSLRNRYARKYRASPFVRSNVSAGILGKSFFDEAPVVSDPLYIGAAGETAVYLGATATTAKYLGTRTLF